MFDYCLQSGRLREIRRENGWMAPPKYLDGSGEVRGMYYDIFERKKKVHDEWVDMSQKLGYFAEEIIREALRDEGYVTQQMTFQVSDDFFDDGSRHVQIDAYCLSPELNLGVEVKNVTSDVYINPDIIKRPNDDYKQLIKRFHFCTTYKIVPILVAPFIDGSFYVFNDMHKGLLCRTLNQWFSSDMDVLSDEISREFNFGNIEAISEAPDRVKRWISRIPKMWKDRYGHW